MIYIHHHLGLGDHIICNGLVRYLTKFETNVTLAVKKHNAVSVKAMYADTNFKFDEIETDQDAINNYTTNIRRIGFDKVDLNNWEASFYNQHHIDYSERWKSFYCERNIENEQDLLNKLNLPEKFAFVNTTASTGKQNITIDTTLPIIELQHLTKNMFDWIPVLERATELHTIDSSIFHLIKQYKFNKRKVFYDTKKLDATRTKHTFEDDSWQTIVAN
jgi:hypothetical protein